ncbi:MAG: DNA-protecting protein DprA [Meiothermus sp.]|jgi:hypothetical protein|nr:DNA-protecting protein DprA [Meiothermus sp.]GIW31485.1 MAG: hypothetical protein KatS3mg071_1659 [Meiothermus sp.]
MKIYAGIGSRQTPPNTLALMKRVASRLAELGWTVRSGGAVGADQAFEAGALQVRGAVEVFLPWPGYNGYKKAALTAPSPEAIRLAADLHPAWSRLSSGVQKLMGRNSHQILGVNLNTPVAFVLCWTPDGAESEAECGVETGGTGQAIRLASRYGVPVFNLYRPDALSRLGDWLRQKGPESHDRAHAAK